VDVGNFYAKGREMIVKNIDQEEDFEETEPTIQLLEEKRADGSSLFMWAYLDTGGCLHIDGQDFGPVTKFISGDGEYEYFYTVAAKDIPALVKVLGGEEKDNVLDILETKWTGNKSYKLGELLRECPIPEKLSTWSG